MWSAQETFSRLGAAAKGTAGVAPTYVGPGDVVSGAYAWWGLRAYTLASIGTAAVRLRRDSDQTESDFNTVSGGGLDIAGITTFKGAANLFVTKLYDQSGHAQHLAQATAANQPAFTLSGLGSLPIVSFVGSTPQYLTGTAAAAQAQPMTTSTVFNQTNEVVDHRVHASSGGATLVILNDNQGTTANAFSLFSGTTVTTPVTCTDGAWHAVQIVWNGATTTADVDGSTTSGLSPGAVGISISGDLTLGANSNTGTLGFYGSEVEWGIWAGSFTGGQQTSMNSNQHTYWGF